MINSKKNNEIDSVSRKSINSSLGGINKCKKMVPKKSAMHIKNGKEVKQRRVRKILQ